MPKMVHKLFWIQARIEDKFYNIVSDCVDKVKKSINLAKVSTADLVNKLNIDFKGSDKYVKTKNKLICWKFIFC